MAKSTEEILKELGLNTDGSYSDDYNKQQSGTTSGNNSGNRTSEDILAALGIEAKTPYQDALEANQHNGQSTKQTAGNSTQLTAEADSGISPMQEQAAAAISGKTLEPGKPSAIRGNGKASGNEPLHYVAEEDRAYNVETAKTAMESAKAAMDAAANSYDGRSGKAYQEAEQAYEEAASRYYVLDDSWIDELYAAQGGGADNSLSNLGQQKEQLQAQRDELAAQRNNIELGYAQRNTYDISDEEWAALDKLDTEIAALDAQIASVNNDIGVNYDYADYRISDTQQKALEDISEREINALDGATNHIQSLTGRDLEELFDILNNPEGEEYAALMQELGELGTQQLGGLLDTLAGSYEKLDKAQTVLGNDSDTFIESMGHAFQAGIEGIRGGTQGTVAWLKEAALRLGYKKEGTPEEQQRIAELDAQMQAIVTEYGGGMGYEQDPRYIAAQQEQREITASLQGQRNEYAAQETQDMYSVAQGYLEQRDRLLQQAKQNAGTFQSIAVDLVENATEMLPDTIISALSAGTGNPAVIACAQNIALALMGVRVFGSENAQMQAQGKGFLERTAYAGVSAGIEIFTEKMFDGLGGIYGKGMVGMEGKELFDIWQDQMIASISDVSKRPAAAVAASLFFGFLGEGTEEVVSSLCEPITNLIVMDKEEWLQNYDIDDSNGWLYDYAVAIANSGEEIGYSFLIGGLMGLFGTVTQVPGTYKEEANNAAIERLNEYLSGEVNLAALCTDEMREELKARGIEGDEAINAFGAAFLEEMKTDGVTAENVTDNAKLWDGMTAAAGVMHPGNTVPKAIAEADGSVSPMQAQAEAAIAPQSNGRAAENTPINAVAEADGAGRTFEQAGPIEQEAASTMQEQMQTAAPETAPATPAAPKAIEQQLVERGMPQEQAAQVAQMAAEAETPHPSAALTPSPQGEGNEITRTVDFSQQSISNIRDYVEDNIDESGGYIGGYKIDITPGTFGGTNITVTDTETGKAINVQGDGFTDANTIAAALYNNERGKKNVNSERGNGIDGGHRREFDIGAGINDRQIRGVSRTAESIPQEQRAEQRRAKGDSGKYETLTGAELIGEAGGENISVRIIPEEDYDDELKAVSESVQTRTGIKPTFILGYIELYNGKRANGYNSDKAIVVSADHARWTAEQIAGHESMHAICRGNAKLRDDSIALIKNKLSSEQRELIYNAYKRQYGFLTDDAKAETYIWEEVACDYYGGNLNIYSGVKLDEKLAEELRNFVDGKPGASQQSNGTAETTGPPTVENANNKAAAEQKVEEADNPVAESFAEEVAKQQAAETKEESAAETATEPETAESETAEREEITVADAVRESSGTAFTDSNERIKFVYAAMPAESIVASHDVYGNANSAYPEELQPRDRSRAQSQMQMSNIAKKPIPERLEASAEAQNGAPIVRGDGVVIGGNGRMAGLQRAYETGAAAEYEQYIRDNAEKWGINPAQLPEHPVLVRVTKSENYAELAKQLNAQTTQRMGASEQAKVDADIIKDIANIYKETESGKLSIKENADFIRAFIAAVPRNERNSMETAKGELSKVGRDRIENALFAAAYNSEELAGIMMEMPDASGANIQKALRNVAAKVVALQQAVEAGNAHDLNLGGIIAEAAELYSKRGTEYETIADYADQYMLEGSKASNAAIALASVFESLNRSEKGIRTFLNGMVDAVNYYGGIDAGGLFEAVEPPTIGDIFRKASIQYEAETGKSLKASPERYLTGGERAVSHMAEEAARESEQSGEQGRQNDGERQESLFGDGRGVSDSSEQESLFNLGDEENADEHAADEETKATQEPVKAASEEKAKKKAEKPAKKTASKVKEELQDFGEKIGGAKKDTWRKRGLSLDDLAQMNEAERGKYTKKDSVWPKCDYEGMVNNGATREAAYFIKLMRDGIPTAPIVKYKGDVDAARSEYIEFVQKMRDGLMKIKTQPDVTDFIKNVVIKKGYAKISEDYSGRTYLGRGEKFTYDGYFNAKMLEACQNGMKGAAALKKLADKKQFLVKQEDKIPAGMEIHQFDGKGWTKSGNWEVGTYYVTKGSFIIQTNFKDYQSALEYAQQLAAKKGNGKKRFVPPQLENVHRIGRDVRDNNTRNVTGEDLLETFKFKGGEFGNWLNQQDRQVSLNYAYDALTDLADLIGISPADISLGGELSIAFGARGEKGAAAHYEPDRTVINLTKMNGAGSLGHEWAHALDNMLGRQYSEPGSDTFATDIARKTKIESLKTLVDDMKYKPMDSEKAKIKAEKEVDNYRNRLNAWLTGFFSASTVNNMTAEQAEKYKQLVDGILSGEETHEDWYVNPDSGLVKGISDFRKELTNRGFSKEDRQKLASYMYQLNAKVKYAEAPTGKEETDFYKGSKAFGKDYSRGMGDGYWDSDIEMFARAFACYLNDRAADIDCRSDYLAGHSESAVTLDDKGNVVAAIPQGAERLKLNEDFDNLIAELKDKGILHAPQEEAEEYNVIRYSLEDEDNAASGTALEEDADDVVKAPDGTLAVRISSAESGLNRIRKGRWANEIARQIRTQLAGRAIIAADGDIIRITERGAREVPYGTNSNNLFREEQATHEKFNRKMITAEHAASIISLSRYSEWTANIEDLTDMFKRDGLNKRVVSLFIDDEPYTAYVLTALNDDPAQSKDYGEKFYDIVGIEKQTPQSAMSGTAITMEASPHKIKYADGSSDMLTINQKNRIVNNREHGITYSGAGTETDADIPEWQRRLVGIAFDDNGNMDGRFSLDDDEYTELAKDPEKNKEQLQAAVDERATEWGAISDEEKPIHFYHGTPNYGFTSFRTFDTRYGLFGTGAYFTSDKSVASTYANNSDRALNKNDIAAGIYDAYLKIDNPIDMDWNASDEEVDAWCAAVEEATGWGYYQIRYAIEDYMQEEKGWTSLDLSNEDLFRGLEKILEVDEYTREESAKIVRDVLTSLGYDGITHIGGGRYNRNDMNRHTVYIAFNEEQIKSAEPVTYDDNGEVIPLSERFNPESKDIRYSLDDKTETEETPETEEDDKAESVSWNGVQGLELGGLSPDEYIEKAMARAAADRADRLRTIGREEFKGTATLDKLGIKISGSAGVYERLDALKKADKTAKAVRRQVSEAEERLKATKGEKEFARGIADGTYNTASIPWDMNADTVNELADWYFAEQGIAKDLITRQRRDIAVTLDAKIQNTMHGISLKKRPRNMVLNAKTPARNMQHLFGDKAGERVYRSVFKPVEENEAERYRFINRQFDEMREFTDSNGRKTPLNKIERKVVQLMVEHQAGAQAVAQMEMSGDDTQIRQAEVVKAAANSILNGTFNAAVLGNDIKLLEAAKSLAKFAEAQKYINSGSADGVKCNNAAEAYKAKYADLYDAINDFLIAHGYEPIGFIKNYAPHMQDDESKSLLSDAFRAMGISDVKNLPTEIAGETASYKPNKRFDPHFLSRTGDETKIDIAEGFEEYIDYLSDILYHTDDIMRIRAFERWVRTFGDVSMQQPNRETAIALKGAEYGEIVDFLRKAGRLGASQNVKKETANRMLDEYIEALNEAEALKGQKAEKIISFLESKGVKVIAESNCHNEINKLAKTDAKAKALQNAPINRIANYLESKGISTTEGHTKAEAYKALREYITKISGRTVGVTDNLTLANALRGGRLADKVSFLEQVSFISKGSRLTEEDADTELERYINSQYQARVDKTVGGPLAMYLNEYANKLAGKQLNGDRSWEHWYGRRSLNIANKLQRAFAVSQVGGKLSSVLNQGAQLPLIYAELGGKYSTLALRDIMTGKLRRADWAANSDFLVGKQGIEYIVEDMPTMVTKWMFKPAELMDGMVSTMAVRGAYLKAINEGMSEQEAMKVADRFGSEVMGNRMKGTKPLLFDSKLPGNRILTMFQIEALNTWEHVAKDLPRDFREIEEKHGKAKAAQVLAGVILKTLFSAFLLNRLDDELYGGTPAPFDIIGLSANFIASGQGLTTNDMLLSVINEAWRKETGEYLFDEDSILGDRAMRYGNFEDGEFSMKAALDATEYNILNEIPIIRNGAALLGLGDSTLPLAGLSSAKDAWSDFRGLATGESTYMDFLNSALETGLEFIPGGSQIKRTYQGVKAFAEGGEFDSMGNLKYAVGDDALTALRMALFGKYSTPEAQAYYAARDAKLPGGNVLSETRMRGFNYMTENGYNNAEAERIMRRFNSLMSGLNRNQENVTKVLKEMNLPNDIAAAIWQGMDKSWKPANNPFSPRVGQQIWDEMNGGN